MDDLKELIRTIRILGLQKMLQLRRAGRLAWPGMMNGFYATRVMQALINVDFVDELLARGSLRIEAFADAHRLDSQVLRALCDTAYALRILDRGGDGYVLTREGRLLGGLARGWFDGAYGYEGVFHQLEALLKKEVVYGRDVRRRSHFVAKGSAEIEAHFYFPLAIHEVRRKGYRRVLDLGCGDGTFLRHLCLQNREVSGCGIDVAPEAISSGREQLKAAGLNERIQLFVQDMAALESLPDYLCGVDAATTFFVLHELAFAGPDNVVRFLSSFRRVFLGIPLLIFEVDRPSPEEMRKRPGMAVPYLLQHDLSQQRLLSREQWRSLIRASGFGRIEERHLSFARSVIFIVQ